jgi:hypothetical protein
VTFGWMVWLDARFTNPLFDAEQRHMDTQVNQKLHMRATIKSTFPTVRPGLARTPEPSYMFCQ